MPELPDVEAFKRYLDATALHHTVEDVHVHERRSLQGVSADRLRKTLRGRELAASRRHGKWLFASAEEDGETAWLALHFGMTGFLAHYDDPDAAPEHVRVSFDLDDGSHLAYDDQRLFGEVRLVESPDAFIEECDLGPDAALPRGAGTAGGGGGAVHIRTPGAPGDRDPRASIYPTGSLSTPCSRRTPALKRS